MSTFTKQEQFRYSMKFVERTGKMAEILCYKDNIMTKVFNFLYVYEYNQDCNKGVIDYKDTKNSCRIVDIIDFSEYDHCVVVIIN